MKKEFKTIYKQWPQVAAVFVFLFYAINRVWMYARYSAAGFGYDTGIYRHIIRGYFERLGDSTLPSFGFSSFSNSLRFLGTNTDDILFLWYILFGMLLCVVFYVVVKLYTKNNIISLIALILFTTSIAQFEFFWWFYYRNLIGLFFVLLSFLFLYYRSYLLVLSLFIIGTIHPLSLVPIGITLLIVFIYDKEKRKYLFISGGVSLLSIFAFNFQEIVSYISLAMQKTLYVSDASKQSSAELTGQFISLDFYIRSAFLYIFFAFAGLIFYGKKYKEWSVFLIVNTILFALGILFYRRFLIFFDVAAIFFAAIFLYYFLQDTKQSKLLRVVAILFFALMFFQSGYHMVSKQPLVWSHEISYIETIDSMVPEDAYLLTINSHYAPWVQGFTNRDVIAPGMFEYDEWVFEEWQDFWHGEDMDVRFDLLRRYDRDIFIFLGDRDMWYSDVLARDSHFIRIKDYLWQVSL
ncbi:hypothetical protein HOF40_00475 [Candidatus Parcubacteria bacterium]|nr:hypothetical protein [Candidatus Parcubacteria bacterium]MBT3948544.1 hypothetical protein [Candidatus Parcubacteria bacterium]